MRTVLVTGANGFIGRHTLPHLLDLGLVVHAVDREPFRTSPNVTMHAVDLLSSDAVAELIAEVRPTDLLHLAWYVAHGKFWNSFDNFRWVDASLGLLTAFAKAGGRRWLGVGSCAEYDWTWSGPMDEHSTPLCPRSIYGAAKAGLYMMAREVARELGVSMAWARLFHTYGPHERPERLAPAVIRALLDDKPALCSHGAQIRDFMYVDDVGRALATVLGSSHDGAVNVCSAQHVSVREFVNLAAAVVGRPELVRFGELAASPGEPDVLVGQAGILNSLGFSPAHPLDSGIRATVQWWIEQNATL